MEEIVVTIDEEGEVTIKVNGVKGHSCTKMTEFIEKELGKVKERKKTKEYFQSVHQSEQAKQRV